MKAVFACVLLLLLQETPILAHAFDPSLLTLEERPEGSAVQFIEVTWSTPVALPKPLDLVLPCPEVAGSRDQAVSADEHTWIQTWQIDCRAASVRPFPGPGLGGRLIRVDGLGLRSAGVLVRWTDSRNRSTQAVLDATHPSVRFAATPEPGTVLHQYGMLGTRHILQGFDHLAFVFGLLLLVAGRRRLVFTLTAFTVGHSVTLALVVLGVMTPPSRWVELGIAASILVLAVELAERLRDPSTHQERLLRRRPWLVAGLFGLLHGCGFAGALREVGLPPGDVPLALLAFNLGIEAGQLLFVALLWLAALLLRRAARALSLEQGTQAVATARLEFAAIYLLGILAANWTLERLHGLF